MSRTLDGLMGHKDSPSVIFRGSQVVCDSLAHRPSGRDPERKLATKERPCHELVIDRVGQARLSSVDQLALLGNAPYGHLVHHYRTRFVSEAEPQRASTNS